VDHRFGDKDSFFGRFSYNPTFNSQPSLFPPVNGVTAGGGIYPGPSNANSQGYMADYIHIFSPTLVLELKGGFTRLNLLTASPSVGSNQSQKFGMPNTDVDPLISGLATVYLTGFIGTGSDFTLGDDRYVPILDINNVFQESGSLTWTKGAHNVKYGATLIRRQLNYFQNTFGLGYFEFTGTGIGAASTAPLATLANLEDLIQGTPNEIQRQINYHEQYFRFWEPAVYVQDDWHAKSWLTVNYGLRWDYFSPITASQGQRSNFSLAGAAACTPTSCNPFIVGAQAGVKPEYTNFEPRLGFAINPRKNSVIRGGFGMSRFAQDYASGSLNLYNPPFISQTINCFPATGSGATACPAGSGTLAQGAPLAPIPSITNNYLFPGTVYAHDLHYPQAYIMQWNLTFQQQFGQNVVSVGYVGQVGRHLQYAPGENIPASTTTLGVYNPLVYSAVLPNVNVINFYTATGASEYNAAQFTFERRYSKGLTFNFNYTFARNLTNISDGGTTGAATVGAILPFNRSYDWGGSDIGIKNRLVARFNYELPFGKNGSRMTKLAIGGWQLNSIAYWQSGLPFSVLDYVAPVPSNVSSLVTNDRPNQIGSCNASNQGYTNWINLSSFTAQAIGSAGNEARDQCYGPDQRSMDFSIFKDFQLKERMKLQFRAEAYNITNTENFGQPNVQINGWSTHPYIVNGKAVNTGGLGAIPTTAGQFGQITASNIAANPRQVQLALKLIF
jgi:hypothetical protein